jgi:ABC-type Zn2+ transport system substrate-binding protein/surface adhesin
MKHSRILAIVAAVMLMASPVMAASEKDPDNRMAPLQSQQSMGMHHKGVHKEKHHKGKHKHKHKQGKSAKKSAHKHKGAGPVHHSVRSSPGYDARRGGIHGTGGWTAQ